MFQRGRPSCSRSSLVYSVCRGGPASLLWGSRVLRGDIKEVPVLFLVYGSVHGFVRYKEYRQLMAFSCKRCEMQVLTYCLMPNHVWYFGQMVIAHRISSRLLSITAAVATNLK